MILLIGFNKTGTTSFQEMFTQLGYESHHFFWNENGRNDILISDLMRDQQKNDRPLLCFVHPEKYYNVCLTQIDACISPHTNYWPQLTDYQRLYYENPDAIFILNKRDPNKLLNSFIHWRPNWSPLKGLSLFERIFKYNPEFFEHMDSNLTQEEKFIELVNTHYHNVEAFFANIPNAKFVSYDIEKDSLEKLSAFMDTKGMKELPRIKPN